MIVILLFGMSTPMQFTVGFTYLLELTPSNYHAILSTTLNIVGVFTVLFCALYFAFVSKDWFYYVLVGYVL